MVNPEDENGQLVHEDNEDAKQMEETAVGSFRSVNSENE
jgi:hypothetical protein